jgi:DNA-binding transcriptional LysR family regulator
MSVIQMSHVRRLDMTQLLVMSALMRHRKLTVVAREIGLTQSAISHILKRLRDTFQDELFLRRPTGMEPTARAFALEPIINDILHQTTLALQIEQSFDPRTENRVMRLSGPDAQMALYVPPLIALFKEEAPGLRLTFTSQTRADAIESLNAGQIDVSISFFWDVPAQFETQKLYEETYVVVMRRGHPIENATLDLQTYCAQEHLLVSARGDLEGIVDTTIAKLGAQRRVTASVAQFFPAMATVATSDLIATIPSRLAKRYGPALGLVCREVPFAVRPFTVSSLWHRRTTSDPALSWLRQKISALAV